MNTKIKQRKGWSRYSKPFLISAPTPPKKFLHDSEETAVFEKRIYENCPISMSDFSIPENVNLNDVKVELIIERDYDADCDYTLKFSTSNIVERENPYFDRELKFYQSSYEKWKIRKEQFKQELKEWNAWVVQEKEEDLQSRLESAKKLLEKHDKLKVEKL